MALMELMMTGCAHEKIYQNPAVPAAFLQDTARPVFMGLSNGDLLEYALDMREALGRCSADKAAVREILGKRDGDAGTR